MNLNSELIIKILFAGFVLFIIYQNIQAYLSVKRKQQEHVSEIESMIITSDRNNIIHASQANDLIDFVDKYNKVTKRQLEQLVILWKSHFAHLYK